MIIFNGKSVANGHISSAICPSQQLRPTGLPSAMEDKDNDLSFLLALRCPPVITILIGAMLTITHMGWFIVAPHYNIVSLMSRIDQPGQLNL